ncbi:MAG: TPM domain-containing protein [Lautropia sp.]|nr:TPM domain-containing protein [Lautropia sp.]
MAGDTRPKRGLGCYWRHSGWAPDPIARAFDEAAFDRIEAAISEGETQHRGEIRFALEPTLSWSALRRGLSPRERALQVFGKHRVWDTEDNTGILIYLLTADHAVEIIADRLAHQRLPAEIWSQGCQQVADACRAGQPVEGVISAIQQLNQALIAALPAQPGADNPNELDNRPVRL